MERQTNRYIDKALTRGLRGTRLLLLADGCLLSACAGVVGGSLPSPFFHPLLSLLHYIALLPSLLNLLSRRSDSIVDILTVCVV